MQDVAWLRLQLHGAIYRPDSFVLMLRYCANLKAIRYESATLIRIVANKSHHVIVALNEVAFKVSSQSRKFEFNVFSIIHLNGHNFSFTGPISRKNVFQTTHTMNNILKSNTKW